MWEETDTKESIDTTFTVEPAGLRNPNRGPPGEPGNAEALGEQWNSQPSLTLSSRS